MTGKKQIEDHLWIKVGHSIIDAMGDKTNVDDYDTVKNIEPSLDRHLMKKFWNPISDILKDNIADQIREGIKNGA